MSIQPIIIIDANAFIRSSHLLQLGTESTLLTTANVLNQIRDQKTRQLLNSFPFEIKVQQPNHESIKFVTNFATKTGDIASLSETDLEIIALGYELCVKKGFQKQLNLQPKQLQQPKIEEQKSSSQYDSSEQEQVDNRQQQNNKKVQIKQQDDGWIIVQPKTKKIKQVVESDDDDGWITPQNYNQKKVSKQIQTVVKEQKLKQESLIPISIITSDFAMQNVILQIGIPMKSVDGLQINSVKRFVLQCYLCWQIYKDVAANKIKTCNKCGYNSLSKISYSLDSHGNMILHRKKGWQPNKQVFEWKQKMLHEQAQRKKNRRKKEKKISIFE